MNVSKRRIIHFFNNVMISLSHYGWTLNIHPRTDSFCWIQSKQIDIGTNYDGDIRQIILHEIAHIGTARFCNQKHNKQFWQHLERLTQKWLKHGLDKQQQYYKYMTGGGIYGICYNVTKG